MPTNQCEFSRLTFPVDTAYAGIAALYVGEIARKMGFDSRDVEDVRTGVETAVRYLIDYSFEPGDSSFIDVESERVPQGLKVAIKDQGMPLDLRSKAGLASEYSPYDMGTGEEEIFRIKQYVDEIQFNNLGRGGKETVLIKRLNHGSITDFIEACELDPYPATVPKPASAPEPLNYTIRGLAPSEAVEVAKCVYKAFGYSYYYEDVYYPERLIELNTNGDVHSAVAVTDSGEIAGHCALVRYSRVSKIGRLAQAVVKPEFRSQGILARLSEYLVDKAREIGLIGLFADAVTVHTYSQRVARKIGLKECGIEIASFPASTIFRRINEDVAERVSALFHFKPLVDPFESVIFPPARHRRQIQKIYKRLGIDFYEGNSQGVSVQTATDSVVKTALYGTLGSASIKVEAYRSGTLDEIKTTLRDLCLKRIELVKLHLNLAAPETAELTEQFEKLGFFFWGIMPGFFPTGDALVLQYLNNVKIDYDEIHLYSQEARDLLAYIRDHAS